ITPPKLVLCAGPDVPPTAARRAFTFVVFDARIRRRRSVRILLSLARAMARGAAFTKEGCKARPRGYRPLQRKVVLKSEKNIAGSRQTERLSRRGQRSP